MAEVLELHYRWETGQVLLDDTIDQGIYETVNFVNTYDDPVVVAYIYTRGGGQSIQCRVRNVTSTSCEIFMQEPDNENHADESVAYMVMEAGTWTHPVLGVMHAGSGNLPDSGGAYFSHPLGVSPCIFATLNTHNNNNFGSTEVQNVSTTQFQLFQAGITGVSRSDETVGYIVLNTNLVGTLADGTDFETDWIDTGVGFGVDDTYYQINYNNTYSASAVVIVNNRTSNGETWWVRAAEASPSSTYHRVYAEEDQVGDSERNHTNEEISWFVAAAPFAEESAVYVREDYGNVSTNSNYHFKANIFNIKVYEKGTTSGIGQVDFNGIASCWANDTNLYFATMYSGILYVPITSISGLNFNDINVYKQEPDVSSNLTNYIHGNADYLCVTTISGTDHYNVVSGTRLFVPDTDATKCWQSTAGEFYYTTRGIQPELVAVYDNLTAVSGYNYTQENFFSGSNYINDLHVVEGVSIYNSDNLLLTATDNGIIVIEEKRGDELNSRTKKYFIS